MLINYFHHQDIVHHINVHYILAHNYIDELDRCIDKIKLNIGLLI